MGLFGKKKEVEQQAQVDNNAVENTVDLKSRMKAIREVGRFSIEQKKRLQEEESKTIAGCV